MLPLLLRAEFLPALNHSLTFRGPYSVRCVLVVSYRDDHQLRNMTVKTNTSLKLNLMG